MSEHTRKQFFYLYCIKANLKIGQTISLLSVFSTQRKTATQKIYS